MTKKLLFSVTKKDLRIDEFRAGGNGGQGQNKRSTGIRVTHPPSGASAEGRDSRSKEQNRKNAFLRMVNSEQFQTWLKKESARISGQEAIIEENVKRLMAEKNIVCEVKRNGRWVRVEASDLSD